MGIALLGGFLWLGGSLVMKAKKLHSNNCAEITLKLPSGATAIHTTFSQENWIVEIATENGAKRILRYDNCGTLLQQVDVK
jgi:hypothetical protein